MAVIGSTGRGGFAHGLDIAFNNLNGAKIIAVADRDTEGLVAVGKKIGVANLYNDYQEMLQEENPDICVVSPGWVNERVAMVEAAASSGCHIYLEKPVAGSLLEIDTMIDTCREANIKVGVAHQWRAMAPVQQTISDIDAGKYGRLLRMWGRPKDDSRGGGEELLLHGTHMFDLMIALAGRPHWVMAQISCGNIDATTKNGCRGSVGLMVGDSISAMFGFGNGVRGFWDSTAGLANPGKGIRDLFGLSIECEKARLELREPGDVYIYKAPRILPDLDLQWERLTLPDWHELENFRRVRKQFLHVGNQILARDLIDSIKHNREPLSSLNTSVYTVEMVQGVYASHLTGGTRLKIPLKNRRHPLELGD